MLIIVEGVDCSGKTTLVNTLVKYLKEEQRQVSVLQKGPPTHSNPVVEYLWPLAGYTPGSGESIICDRWHIGELVYPKILNRTSIMPLDCFDAIHKTLANLGALIVYLEPPLSVIHKRFNERGDKLITNIDTLNESYFEFRTITSRFKFEYDPRVVRFSSIEFTKDIIDGIMWTAQMREEAHTYD